MSFIIITIFIIYALGISWYTVNLKKLKEIQVKAKENMNFSIIIAAKNEINRIATLLNDLKFLTYDKGEYEIMLIDDYSTDDLETFSNNFSIPNFRYLKNENKHGKANAIKFAIEQSKYSNLVCLDADVSIKQNFLEQIRKSLADCDYDLALGNIIFDSKEDSFCSQYSKIESSTLVNFGLIDAINLNPTMANGANMVINKASLEKIGGYPTYSTFKAGEDTLLVQKFKKYKNIKVLNLRCVTTTFVETNWKDYFKQKKRWLQKSKYFKGTNQLKIKGVEFFYYFLFLGIIYLIIDNNLKALLVCLGIKTLIDIAWVFKLVKLNQLKVNVKFLLLLPIIQILLMPIVFVYSKFGKINWR